MPLSPLADQITKLTDELARVKDWAAVDLDEKREAFEIAGMIWNAWWVNSERWDALLKRLHPAINALADLLEPGRDLSIAAVELISNLLDAWRVDIHPRAPYQPLPEHDCACSKELKQALFALEAERGRAVGLKAHLAEARRLLRGVMQTEFEPAADGAPLLGLALKISEFLSDERAPKTD